MVSSGAAGLGYSITKDLLRLHRREALVVQLEAERLGSAVHLRVTVRPVLGAGKVTIKHCSAIRKRPAAGCIEGDECAFPELRFRPVGPPSPTLEGNMTAQWTATLDANRVLHLQAEDVNRREIEVFGSVQEPAVPMRLGPSLPPPTPGSFREAFRLLRHAYLYGNREDPMPVTAVVVTSTGKEVRSNTVWVPPSLPPNELAADQLKTWSEERRKRRQQRSADDES